MSTAELFAVWLSVACVVGWFTGRMFHVFNARYDSLIQYHG